GRLSAAGGGGKSRAWFQFHAVFLGKPIHLPRECEACALGSALVAAVHCGHYANLDEAAQNMLQIDGVVEPGRENRRIYDECYARYLATYQALRPLMHESAAKE